LNSRNRSSSSSTRSTAAKRPVPTRARSKSGSGGRRPEDGVPLRIVEDPILARQQLFVDAEYHNAIDEIEEYRNNLLILALPPFTDEEKILKALARHFSVSHPPECRTWSNERRIMAVGRIDRLFVILPVHSMLLNWVHSALRNQYVRSDPARNPHVDMNEAYRRVQRGEPGVIADLVEDHAACRALVGVSGTGKTTAVKIILSLFPPIIQHESFRGVSCRFRQIVWVFVTAPANGSVMAFLRGILLWVDLHLGTGYLEEMKASANIGEYIAKVIVVLTRYYTGLLVIDEFQNVLKAAAKTELLDMLINLLNSRCCAVLLLGTPDGMTLLKTRLRLARRATSDGYDEVKPFVAGPVWDKFAGEILEKDFLRKGPVCSRTKTALSATLLSESAGLAALAKQSARVTQYEGIVSGREALTVDLMQQATRHSLSSLSGMVAALKSGDHKLMERYADMCVGDADRAHEHALAAARMQAVGGGSDEIDTEVFAEAMSSLIYLRIPETEAEKLVLKVMSNSPGLASEAVVREALRIRGAGANRDGRPAKSTPIRRANEGQVSAPSGAVSARRGPRSHAASAE